MDISLPYLDIFTEKGMRPPGNIFLSLSIPTGQGCGDLETCPAAASLELGLMVPGD